MADDMAGLLSPGVISRVGHDLPRREQQQPPPKRRQPPRVPPAAPSDDLPSESEPARVGSRLNVCA